MPKNIALFFDGTWNKPGSGHPAAGDSAETNVCKLHQAMLESDMNGIRQFSWYDPGVGTEWYRKLTGGLFGRGLGENIREGYAQLIREYEEGDHVFLFGFSRGAYTARSLAGLIRKCGLLRKGMPGEEDLIRKAYRIYRMRDAGPDTDTAKAFRAQYAREIEIHFLGVWDTVGSLGIPLSSLEWFNRGLLQFHDTQLSRIVRHAYHAVAIDEHREDYQATLWTPGEPPAQQEIEQVWFPGAHANVGGGYPGNALSDLPLLWMMEKAERCGLALEKQRKPQIPQSLHTEPVVDSYRHFLGGVYKIFKKRYYRPIGTTSYNTEQIHSSVEERCRHASDYRPMNPVGINLSGSFRPAGKYIYHDALQEGLASLPGEA